MVLPEEIQVGDDMSVVVDFKPPWIRTEIWKQMIDIWNTPEWKAKSQRNTNIRSKSTGGIHTLGSQTYLTAKRKAAKAIGRELSHLEMWKQSHCKKGSRPLDKDLSYSGSIVEDVDLEDVDLEGNIQEENLDWVDDRARETWFKYKGFLVDKYGMESSKHPTCVDEELWIQAVGGKKKGKVYGLNNVNDSYVHGRQNPKIEKLNEVMKELVKEKEEEKERMNGIIKELVAENETMRMEKFEEMLKTMTQRD